MRAIARLGPAHAYALTPTGAVALVRAEEAPAPAAAIVHAPAPAEMILLSSDEDAPAPAAAIVHAPAPAEMILLSSDEDVLSYEDTPSLEVDSSELDRRGVATYLVEDWKTPFLRKHRPIDQVPPPLPSAYLPDVERVLLECIKASCTKEEAQKRLEALWHSWGSAKAFKVTKRLMWVYTRELSNVLVFQIKE